MAGGGEGDHVGEENKHTDQLDSHLKPTKVLHQKKGKGRSRKIQVVQHEEQGEGGNASNNEEILLNQRLLQLPWTSKELLPRKRGRPRKRPAQEVNGEQGGEGGHGGQKYETCLRQPQTKLPMTLSQGISSAEIAFASESRCLTRNMKAYLDRCPIRATPSKSPVRNVMTTAANKQDHSTTVGDISAAQSSSNHRKNQGLSFSPTSLMCHSLNAIALPSETDNQNASVLTKLRDQPMSADHGLQDINEHAADLLAQNHGSGVVCRANPSDLKFIVENYQLAEEAHMPSNVTINTSKETASKSKQSGACPSRSVSLNLTQMCLLMDDDLEDFDEVRSRLDEALVSVNGYEVKAEVAPILRDIFFRYGDIAKECTFRAVKSRSCLLENVCGIYRRMEGANFMFITATELNSLLEEVRDLETAKIELGWLHYRLDEILEAKKDFKSLKEGKRRITEATERRKQVLEGYKKELEALRKKIREEENALAVEEVEEEKLHEKFNNMKSTLKGLYRKSLVHGLL